MKVDEDQNELVLQKMLNPITPSKSAINNIKHYRVKINDVYLAPSQSQLSFTTAPKYVTVTQQTNDSVTIHAKKKSAVKYYSLDDGSEDDIIEGGTTQNQNLQEHPDSIVATTVDANIDYSFVWTEDLRQYLRYDRSLCFKDGVLIHFLKLFKIGQKLILSTLNITINHYNTKLMQKRSIRS